MRNNIAIATVYTAITFFCIVSTAHGGESLTGMAEVNGTTLYYEVQGNGEPLVFIHGGIIASSEWDAQFTAFAEHHQVIRYDVRGHGKSATRRVPYSDSEDLYQLLRFLKVTKASIVGGSGDGSIAVDFALEHPDMVHALVLVGAVVSGWPYSPEFTQRAMPIFLSAADEGPEKGADLWLADPHLIPALANPAVRQRFRQLFIENYHGYLAPYYLARTPKPPALQRLSQLQVPTLILLGELDFAEVITIAEMLSTKIATAKKTVIPHVGHLPQMEKPEEFNRIVLDFLKNR
ncbi:MAG: alpha/beta hydrolase [Deltaproteobacteria bacterium]|nr:alpha/beta hydrolase [Deltaproteobacteria bacterium]